MKGRDLSHRDTQGTGGEDLGSLPEGNDRAGVATPAGGIKAVMSVRMDGRTLEALNEYAGTICEKPSTVARGFIVEGLERAGVRLSSDELHELTRMRMKEELAQGGRRVRGKTRKGDLRELQSAQHDLSYWLSRPAEERVAAVDHLRKERHGSGARLQRVARVIQRA